MKYPSAIETGFIADLIAPLPDTAVFLYYQTFTMCNMYCKHFFYIYRESNAYLNIFFRFFKL